jgi:hypothetical protein
MNPAVVSSLLFLLVSDYAAPDIGYYYDSLRMPDNPMVSCCGVGDAYYADITETEPATGGLVAVITDERPDSFILPDGRTINRRHIPVGTKFVVPKHKLRKPPIPNPTGHTIIFIGAQMNVLCYEPQALG